jgi:hypothetical protein
MGGFIIMDKSEIRSEKGYLYLARLPLLAEKNMKKWG